MTARVAIASYPITRHRNWADWVVHMETWVADAARQEAQLLLFPEYGAMELTGLLSETDQQDLQQQLFLLQQFKDPFLEVLERLARTWNVMIVAPSFPVWEAGKVLNRAYVLSPKGLAGWQDKFFMTRFENESWGIHAGLPELKVFEADWGAFGIQICYDVEFPIGAALLCEHGAGLILAPSCTETIRGATRVHVGARARALENQCFVAVSQTIGDAPWSPAVDVNYGYAGIYSTPDKGLPEEGIIARSAAQKAGWLLQELDFSLNVSVRADGHVFNFKDQQDIGYLLRGNAVEVVRVVV